MTRVGVVDIGTNSMRLLITDGSGPGRRWVEITGLGHGVDATGVLSEEAMERTIGILEGFSTLMAEAGVEKRAALATSATRDASNGSQFLDWAEIALGVRPELATGEREGFLAFGGAADAVDVQGEVVVCDIGGGSTEIVTRDTATSIDIGSVRLTDRILTDRPPPAGQVEDAFEHVGGLFDDLETRGPLVGVAGTWTSLGAISKGLAGEDPGTVHGMTLEMGRLDEIFDHLLGLTVEETALLPGLDPRRAPVILAGALIAVVAAGAVGSDRVSISERDTLDGMAKELLALP
jgi:exopolyphosphatase/guanosine-5'-triphosphate,3'-diphosphate pyrophosphatase